MHGIEIEQMPDHDLRTMCATLRASVFIRTIARTALPCFNSSS